MELQTFWWLLRFLPMACSEWQVYADIIWQHYVFVGNLPQLMLLRKFLWGLSEIQNPKLIANTLKVCGKRIQRIPCTIKQHGKKRKKTWQNGQKRYNHTSCWQKELPSCLRQGQLSLSLFPTFSLQGKDQRSMFWKNLSGSQFETLKTSLLKNWMDSWSNFLRNGDGNEWKVWK